MFWERVSNGWELAKSSLAVLGQNKKLLLFPLLSGIACLLVLASFGVGLYGSDYAALLAEDDAAAESAIAHDPVAWAILFAFYFCNYFVIVFFNAALIACAIKSFRGEVPTLADGFAAAVARLPAILAWALVAATVGVVLQVIRSRSKRVGQIVAGLLGAAWSVATFFVVPVIVMERGGPLQAVKRSVFLLRQSWGETLVSNFGLGLVIFLAGLLATLPAIIGVLLGNVLFLIGGIALTVLLWIGLALVSSAANTILVGALYDYATDGRSPMQFERGRFEQAFVPNAK